MAAAAVTTAEGMAEGMAEEVTVAAVTTAEGMAEEMAEGMAEEVTVAAVTTAEGMAEGMAGEVTVVGRCSGTAQRRSPSRWHQTWRRARRYWGGLCCAGSLPSSGHWRRPLCREMGGRPRRKWSGAPCRWRRGR